MIIICEECGKKYKLDPGRIKGPAARFACKSCGHLITVSKSTPSPKPSKPAPAPIDTPVPEAKPAHTVPAVGKSAEGAPPPKKPQKKKPVSDGFMPLRRFRFGLTAKLFTVMILISLIPLVMFWGITLSTTKARIRSEATRYSTQWFSNVVRYMDGWFGENEKVIKALAEMDAIVSMDPTKQAPLLEAACKIHPQLEGIFIVDASGKFFSGLADRRLEDYSAQSFFQNLMRNQAPAWQISTSKSTGQPILTYAVSVKNSTGTVGVIVHSIQIDKISKQVAGNEAAYVGIAFLLKSKQATNVYPIDVQGLKQKQFNWSPLIEAYNSGRTGPISLQNKQGDSVLGYIGRTKFGWGVAIQKDELEVSALIDQLTSFAYLMLGVIVVFVSIVAWFSGRALSGPIVTLTHAANRISIGELDMEIQTKRKDEIGDLSDAIARLQDSIRISLERLRRRL